MRPLRALRYADTALVRFAIVAVGGLAIDLMVSLALASKVGLPLPIAAMGGFLVAATCNYVVHEKWTFGGGRSLSTLRGSIYLMVMAATLGVRVSAVSALKFLDVFASGQNLPPLLLATGVSFCFNFAVSKYLVFHAGVPSDEIVEP